jgi:hypothetical protein
MPVVKQSSIFMVKQKPLVAPPKKQPVKRKLIDLATVPKAVPLTAEERSKPPHRKLPVS